MSRSKRVFIVTPDAEKIHGPWFCNRVKPDGQICNKKIGVGKKCVTILNHGIEPAKRVFCEECAKELNVI